MIIHPHGHLLEIMISLSGVARFRGVFAAFKDKHGRTVEALAMFDSLATGTTLALPISKVSAVAVRKHTLASDVLFEKFCNKSAANILRQFATKEPA